MSTKFDVLIVGGGPAGIATALFVRRFHPDKNIALVRDVERSIVPCAIPYLFGTLRDVSKLLIPDSMLERSDVEIIVGKVVDVDASRKRVKLADGREFEYEKLILATGSEPVVPPIEGADKENVFTLRKDPRYLARALEVVEAASSVMIVGAGTSGVELADDLAKSGKEVHLVEILELPLALCLDREFCELVRMTLEERGVRLHLGVRVNKLVGDHKAERALLSDGSEVRVDAVIIAVGMRPRVELAKRIRLLIGVTGGIATDSLRRTNVKDIYAVGDCAEKRDLISGAPCIPMLASVAALDARIAAANLYETRLTAPGGVVQAFLTRVGELVVGCAGLTESGAQKVGVRVRSVSTTVVDRHPTCLPGARELRVKVTFTPTGRVAGVQAAGSESVLDILGFATAAIYAGAHVDELLFTSSATQPLLTPAPLVSPLHLCSALALKRLMRS